MLVPAWRMLADRKSLWTSCSCRRRPPAVDAVGVGRQRFVERRQHLARLGDLCRIADVEEIAIDDGTDAERDVVQLDSKRPSLAGIGAATGMPLA